MAVIVVPTVTPVPEITCPTAIAPEETAVTVRVVPALPTVPLSIRPMNDVTVPYGPSGAVDETRVTVGTAVSVRNVFPEVIVVLAFPAASAPETETVVVPST
jgi:hypothetical protein